VKKLKQWYFTITVIFLLLLSGIAAQGVTRKQPSASNTETTVHSRTNNFYFIQITDTHVMNKIFDWNEVSKKRLRSLLDHICSFEKKPAFIAITGDLTEWGGNKISGALNCRAFVSCFYEKNDSFYADKDYSIPIYTTPGNHDYSYNRNLTNYYRFICSVDRYIVQYENVSLFFMNSGPCYFGELYNWIDNIDGDGLYDNDIEWLQNNLDQCTSSIKIILMHHPAVNTRDEKGDMWQVLAHNREEFISICEQYGVEAVLTGHTHEEKILDGNETVYPADTQLNCSLYPTLFVQTDDCKQSVHYRNISINGSDVWLEHCVEVNTSFTNDATMTFQQIYLQRRFIYRDN
jgi:predicted MPP superfamily phosphohydrolase